MPTVLKVKIRLYHKSYTSTKTTVLTVVYNIPYDLCFTSAFNCSLTSFRLLFLLLLLSVPQPAWYAPMARVLYFLFYLTFTFIKSLLPRLLTKLFNVTTPKFRQSLLAFLLSASPQCLKLLKFLYISLV
jgi:hypothetical protein